MFLETLTLKPYYVVIFIGINSFMFSVVNNQKYNKIVTRIYIGQPNLNMETLCSFYM